MPALPESSFLATLDQNGKNLTSKELATKLAQWQQENKQISVIISGTWGLTQEVK